MKRIKLGFSPCPNDTFIMAGIGTGKTGSEYAFDIYIEDVETLNQWAMSGRLDITKMSFFAFARVLSEYSMLYRGCALGRGAGPLLVTTPGKSIDDIKGSPVASPGRWTTASALLSFYLGYEPDFRYMLYRDVMASVTDGEVASGLLIHEGRFTYKEYGLEMLLDLGQWWEQETGLPIPLGGFFIRRSMGSKFAREMDHLIGASLRWAKLNHDKAMEYVMRYAQELKPSVVKQHIGLYVNDETEMLSHEGIEAVERFLELCEKRGIIPKISFPILAY